jgi:hypothetical protein
LGLSKPGWGFSWDEKAGGVQLLLYQLTKKDVYKKAVKATLKLSTLNLWLPGSGITYTPMHHICSKQRIPGIICSR